MLKPQQPFKTPTITSQEFFDTPSRKHLGKDEVPISKLPDLVYPILDGTLRYFYETYNGKNSKAIAIDTWLDDDLAKYVKENTDKIPADYTGKILLTHLYLHGLEIIDKDGFVDQATPIMKCGNTGYVFTYSPSIGGYIEVPEEQKGVPPYPGLHLHLQLALSGENNKYFGVIDPNIILNYKNMANQAVVVKSKNSQTVYICYPMPNLDYLTTKASLEGFEVPNPIPSTDSL